MANLHDLEKAILELGDKTVAIDEFDLQIPKAKAARRLAMTHLINAQVALEKMFDLETKATY